MTSLDDNRDSNQMLGPSVYNLIAKTSHQFAEDLGMTTTNGENDKVFPENENGETNRLSNFTEDTENRKSLMNRIFSKMEEGSLRGSIFAMSSLALGTGCLALPLRFGQMSLLGALIMLILGSMAAYWSLVIMIEASKKTNTMDYSRLVKESLGSKLALLLDIIILIYIFGILISYQVIIYKLIGYFIYAIFFAGPNYKEFKDFNEAIWSHNVYKFPIMYGICLLLVPLCLLKDISKMRVASLFSICSLIYAILVIIVECPFYVHNFLQTYELKDINWYDMSKGFDKNLYFFRGTATIFFAYTCHVGAFPVYKTLKNNITRRVNKVFMRSIVLDILIYITVGICGYLTQPIDTPDLIIYREKYLKNDIAMDIARLGMAINLMLSTPANYNAFRLSVMEITWGTSEVTDKRNWLITIPTLLITCLVGALYDKIINYISILGGFCSVTIAFLFPGLLYVKNSDYHWSHKKNISTLIIITVLCITGFIAGTMTIIDIISPDKKEQI